MTQARSLPTQYPVARSYLFVPGNRPEQYAKALAAGADAVIVDLEDAVPPEDKHTARQHVAEWLSTERSVLLRINGTETSWFQDDIRLCHSPGVIGILLPKTQRLEDVASLAYMVPRKPILPLIETAIGFSNAVALGVQPGVQRLVFGSIDFQVDMGIDGDGEELLYFRSQLVLASRLANLQPPVDGVFIQMKDLERLRVDTQRSRRLGFGAKLCIHPNQVAVVNDSFSPSAEELAWAQRVLEAVQRAGGGAIAVDGKMVDLPVTLKAQGILRASRRPVSGSQHTP
jgi:citrate lyase subunit beta/citryl-CoA lyase